MELTKKEMKIAIVALVNWQQFLIEQRRVKQLEDVDSLITKFDTYLKGGETNG